MYVSPTCIYRNEPKAVTFLTKMQLTTPNISEPKLHSLQTNEAGVNWSRGSSLLLNNTWNRIFWCALWVSTCEILSNKKYFYSREYMDNKDNMDYYFGYDVTSKVVINNCLGRLFVRSWAQICIKNNMTDLG